MTRFNKYFLILLLLVPGVSAFGQSPDTLLSLQQCIDIAIAHNLQVKQSGLTADQDKIYYNQAKENLLPSISGSAGRQLSQGRGINSLTNTYVNQSQTQDNYGLSGSLVLFNGLALQNAIKQTSLAYQAGKMDFKAAKDAVTVNVITFYLSVLDSREILEQNKSQLAAAKEQVDRLQILEQQGANKAASDYTDIQGQYAAAEVNLVSSQNALKAAMLNLFQVLNIPYNQKTVLQPLNAEDLKGDYGISADDVYNTALQQLALVKAATLHRESYEKAVKVAKGQLFPTLSVNGNLFTSYSSTAQKSIFVDSVTNAVQGLYAQGPNGKESIFSTTAAYNNQNIGYWDQFKNNYGSYVTVGLNIPIFTNYTKRNNVALAKINLELSRATEDNTKVQLRENIEQAYYNMQSAYNRYQALTAQVKAYTESFRIYKIRFEAGVLTSVDYVLAKNNMDSAAVNLISARYDYFIYSKILDYYQGKLSSF